MPLKLDVVKMIDNSPIGSLQNWEQTNIKCVRSPRKILESMAPGFIQPCSFHISIIILLLTSFPLQ